MIRELSVHIAEGDEVNWILFAISIIIMSHHQHLLLLQIIQKISPIAFNFARFGGKLHERIYGWKNKLETLGWHVSLIGYKEQMRVLLYTFPGENGESFLSHSHS